MAAAITLVASWIVCHSIRGTLRCACAVALRRRRRFQARWSRWSHCARSSCGGACEVAAYATLLERLLGWPTLRAGAEAALGAVARGACATEVDCDALDARLLGAFNACVAAVPTAAPVASSVALALAVAWLAHVALHALTSFVLVVPSQLLDALLCCAHRLDRCSFDEARVDCCLRCVGTSRRALASLERMGSPRGGDDDEGRRGAACDMNRELVEEWTLLAADGAVIDAVYVPPAYCCHDAEGAAASQRIGTVVVCNGSGESFRRSLLHGNSQLLARCVCVCLHMYLFARAVLPTLFASHPFAHTLIAYIPLTRACPHICSYTAKGFGVVCFDYRGVGRSRGVGALGVATNLGLLLDVDAALQLAVSIVARRSAARRAHGGARAAAEEPAAASPAIAHVMLHGRGLGAALAAQVAALHPGAVLCVERAFASLSDFFVEVVWSDFRARFVQLMEWEREQARRPSSPTRSGGSGGGDVCRRRPLAIVAPHFRALRCAVALSSAWGSALRWATCRSPPRGEAPRLAEQQQAPTAAEQRTLRLQQHRDHVAAIVRYGLAAAGWELETADAWERVRSAKFVIHHPLDGVVLPGTRLMDALNRRLLLASDQGDQSARKQAPAYILPHHVVVLSERGCRSGSGRRASQSIRGAIAHNRALDDAEWRDFLFSATLALE